MKLFNITPLITLINETAAKLAFSKKSKTIKDPILNDAVKELICQETEDNLKQAAIIIKNLYNNHKEAVGDELTVIEDAKAAIALAEERISSLNTAKVYGEQTNNFLPLTVLLEENLAIIGYEANIKLEQFCIPVDFKVS